MKGLLRTCSTLLVLLLVISCIGFGYASEDVKGAVLDNIIYSENEMMILSECSEEELEEKGFSEEEIDSLKKMDYRELLLERGQLPYETLKNYGYSNEQIRILKDYKGEKITKNSEILKAAATLSATPYITTYSREKIGIRFEWKWSLKPVYNMTDGIAIKWRASLKDGIAEGKATESFALIRYFNINTGKEDHVIRKNANSSIQKQCADVTFPMLDVSANETWAKEGTFYLTVQSTNTGGNLDHVSFFGSYGHKTISCTMTIHIVDDVMFPVFLPNSKVTTTNFVETIAYYDGRLVKG